MTDEIMHTVVPTASGGWGGTALGAGVGGLVGSWLGNGGFGGFGGRGVAGYDAGALNGIQGQLNNISNQISNADRDLLMQTSNQNQFLGNLVNNSTDALNNTINFNARDTQAGIFQNTLTATQNAGQTNLAMCNGFGGLNSTFIKGISDVNLNISNQAAESRLQAQQLAAQQQQCCCQVIKTVTDEACKNRELQRAIQYENTRDQLAAAQAENQALKAQLFNTNQVNAQTNVLLAAINNISKTGS